MLKSRLNESTEDNQDNDSVKVVMANRLFLSDQKQLNSSFQETINKDFDGAVEQVNFDNVEAVIKVSKPWLGKTKDNALMKSPGVRGMCLRSW